MTASAQNTTLIAPVLPTKGLATNQKTNKEISNCGYLFFCSNRNLIETKHITHKVAKYCATCICRCDISTVLLHIVNNEQILFLSLKSFTQSGTIVVALSQTLVAFDGKTITKSSVFCCRDRRYSVIRRPL